MYVLELSIIATSYIGLGVSALWLPAINPAATPLWPPTGFALALVLLRGYRADPEQAWRRLKPRGASPHGADGRKRYRLSPFTRRSLAKTADGER